MNLKNVFLLMLATVLFFSCDTENTMESTPNQKTTGLTFVGEWTLENVEYAGTSTADFPDFETYVSSFTGQDQSDNVEIEFGETPTNFETSGTYSVLINNEYKGYDYTEYLNDLNFLNAGSWSFQDDVLTIHMNDGGSIGGIVTMVDDDHFIWEIDFVRSYNPEAVLTTYNINGKYTFQRQ